MTQNVISSMTILHEDEKLNITFSDWLSLSQMFHLLKFFQDPTNVLCAYMNSLEKTPDLRAELGTVLCSITSFSPTDQRS